MCNSYSEMFTPLNDEQCPFNYYDKRIVKGMFEHCHIDLTDIKKWEYTSKG